MWLRASSGQVKAFLLRVCRILDLGSFMGYGNLGRLIDFLVHRLMGPRETLLYFRLPPLRVSQSPGLRLVSSASCLQMSILTHLAFHCLQLMTASIKCIFVFSATLKTSIPNGGEQERFCVCASLRPQATATCRLQRGLLFLSQCSVHEAMRSAASGKGSSFTDIHPLPRSYSDRHYLSSNSRGSVTIKISYEFPGRETVSEWR